MKKFFNLNDQSELLWTREIFSYKGGTEKFRMTLQLIARLKREMFDWHTGYLLSGHVNNRENIWKLAALLGVKNIIIKGNGDINSQAINLLLDMLSADERVTFDNLVEIGFEKYSPNFKVNFEEDYFNSIKHNNIYKNIKRFNNNMKPTTLLEEKFRGIVENAFNGKRNMSTSVRKQNKDKNLNIENYKLFIDDKFRTEELSKLFGFLDEFNAGNEDRKRLEDLILIVGQLLSISKFGVTKKGVIKLSRNVIGLFESIGLKEEIVNNIFKYIDKVSEESTKGRLIQSIKVVKGYNNKNINKVENYKINDNEEVILKLIEIADRRKVILSDSKIAEIIEILNLIGTYNYDDLTKNVELLINTLINDFNEIVSQDKREFYRKRKLIVREMTHERYSKELEDSLEAFYIKCRQISVNFFTNYSKELIELMDKRYIVIFDVIINMHNQNIDRLTKKFDKLLDYNKQSMSLVNFTKNIDIVQIKNNIKLDSIFQLKDIMDKIDKEYPLENINNNDNIKLGKIEKYTLKNNPLTTIIDEIIHDEKLNLQQKQLAIEKALLHYDLNWLESEGLYSANVKNTILHDIYNKIDKGLTEVLDAYRRNKYRELKLILNQKKLFKYNEGVTILALMLLGNKIVINVCFKIIIEIITSSKEGEINDRTVILFKIADRLVNLVKIGLSKFVLKLENDNIDFKFIDEGDKDVRNIIQFLNIDYLNKMINDIGPEQKSALGDSVLRLILNKCDLVKEVHTISNNKTQISLSINDSLFHKLTISTVNVTQLPMLVKPNQPSPSGFYLPYLNPEISHIFNSFDTIIKNKYDNMIPTEQQSNIIPTINYLNGVRFKINQDVLNKLYLEWSNLNSLIFKGQNVLKVIKNGMTTKEKREIASHNSKYWHIENTINIATLYADSSFYLPTFADFRGRVYTLTHYLTYIGIDIARSLLLFDQEENELNVLTQEGFDYLKVYLANLAGNSNLTWNNRLNWTDENIYKLVMLYYNNWEEFYDVYLKELKEPWQFISIMLGVLKAIHSDKNNQITIINNPILFDASCSGIQHLSAITRDIEIARKVNIIPSEDLNNADNETLQEKSTGQDYYMYAAKKVQIYLDNCENKKFNNILLTRALVKRTVMTIPYNVTLHGVRDQLLDFIKLVKIEDKIFYELTPNLTKDNKTMFLLNSEFSKFVDIMFRNLVDIPSLSKLTNYLNKLLKIIMKLNMPIIWTAPSGLKISLSIRQFESKITQTNLVEYSKPITIKLPLNKLDNKSIISGFMPNLIHSLDASNIHLLIPKLTDQPLYTVHDCFATTANNMSKLDNLIKETFIQIYFTDGNYLSNMHTSLVKQIKDNVSEILINKKGEEYVVIKCKTYIIPQIPIEFTSTEHNELFMNGIFKSKFFIN
jgi:hypothetical protein